MPEKTIRARFTQNARHNLRESQLEFADHCGICVKTLSEIELGNANPTLEVIQKIAAYIGAAPYEMLMPEPDRNGETDDEDSLYTVSPRV